MRRLAYALLALIWIAGIWIWFQRAPDALPLTPVPPSEESVPAASAHLDPATPRPAIAPSARQRRRLTGGPEAVSLALVRVRSSVGLPLLFVEVSIAGEDWIEVALPENGLEVEPEAYPLRVRAAGHVEADAPRGASEVVLEPDALLTVESKNLRTRAGPVESLRGSNRSSRQSGVLTLFPEADLFMVAFSPARLKEFHAGDVDVAFSCPDGRPVEILVRPIPGLRARYQLAPDDLNGTAPLAVEVELPNGEPRRSRLWLTELGPARGSALREDFSWGSVSIGAPRPPEFPDRIWGRKNGSCVEVLALGRSFALTALDEQGNFGRIEFVHDGSDRTIVLQPPFTVAGRAIDALSSAPLGWPDVSAHAAGESEDSFWSARAGPIDEQGSFELRLPGTRWGTEGGLPPLEPPERFVVLVSASAHRSLQLEFEWNGRRRVDLGTLALARNDQLAITVDTSDLLLASWSALQAFTFADEPALEWTLRNAVARTDGLREFELWSGSSESTVRSRNLVSGEVNEIPFAPRDTGRMLLRAGHEAFAFRRDEDRTYRVLPRRSHKVAVQCEKLPDGGAWTLGWRGAGTWAGFRTVSARGPVAEWILLPEQATELWWSAGEAPAELCKKAGGSLRLEGNEQTLVLR